MLTITKNKYIFNNYIATLYKFIKLTKKQIKDYISITVSDYLATRLGSALVDDSDATVQGGMTDVRERIDGLISSVAS